ncbi:hypothetical protein PAPHI01_1839 [Pancytospora philotis]|nr:hypothetical protein PAPHI01_1839 [Pancytospora philotis]
MAAAKKYVLAVISAVPIIGAGMAAYVYYTRKSAGETDAPAAATSDATPETPSASPEAVPYEERLLNEFPGCSEEGAAAKTQKSGTTVGYTGLRTLPPHDVANKLLTAALTMLWNRLAAVESGFPRLCEELMRQIKDDAPELHDFLFAEHYRPALGSSYEKVCTKEGLRGCLDLVQKSFARGRFSSFYPLSSAAPLNRILTSLVLPGYVAPGVDALDKPEARYPFTKMLALYSFMFARRPRECFDDELDYLRAADFRSFFEDERERVGTDGPNPVDPGVLAGQLMDAFAAASVADPTRMKHATMGSVEKFSNRMQGLFDTYCAPCIFAKSGADSGWLDEAAKEAIGKDTNALEILEDAARKSRSTEIYTAENVFSVLEARPRLLATLVYFAMRSYKQYRLRANQ